MFMIRERLQSPEQKAHTIESIVAETPEVAGVQAYEYFRNDNVKQRDRFIAADHGNPHLAYPLLTRENLARLSMRADEAMISLLPGEQNDKTKALFDALEYRHAEIFMLNMAADMHNPALSSTERTEATEWFVTANEALYGLPDVAVFSAAMQRDVLGLLRAASENMEHSFLQHELRDLLGEVAASNEGLHVPSELTVQRLRGLVLDRFTPLVDYIDIAKTYTAVEMRDAFQESLARLEGDALGWRAALVPSSSALAVSAHQKIIEIGENKKDLDGLTLQGKVVHEAGVHAGRSITAAKAGWLSAAYGQEGYLDFEESLATIFEDLYTGADSVGASSNYYIACGLALGLDNHAPRDFRGVYEIMWRKKALEKITATQPELSKETLEKAKRAAYSACVRIFRGTPCDVPGMIYTKDLAYFRGQELAWEALDDVETQEDIDLLLTGKLDLTRPEHARIAHDIALAY